MEVLTSLILLHKSIWAPSAQKADETKGMGQEDDHLENRVHSHLIRAKQAKETEQAMENSGAWKGHTCIFPHLA